MFTRKKGGSTDASSNRYDSRNARSAGSGGGGGRHTRGRPRDSYQSPHKGNSYAGFQGGRESFRGQQSAVGGPDMGLGSGRYPGNNERGGGGGGHYGGSQRGGDGRANMNPQGRSFSPPPGQGGYNQGRDSYMNCQREGGGSFMTSQRMEGSFDDRNASYMDSRGGGGGSYMGSNRRDEGFNQGQGSADSFRRGSASQPFMDRQRGGNSSFTNPQRGTSSPYIDSQRGGDASYMGAQRGVNAPYMDTQRRGDAFDMGSQGMGQGPYMDLRGLGHAPNAPYMDSQGMGHAPYMDSQRGGSTPFMDQQRSGWRDEPVSRAPGGKDKSMTIGIMQQMLKAQSEPNIQDRRSRYDEYDARQSRWGGSSSLERQQVSHPMEMQHMGPNMMQQSFGNQQPYAMEDMSHNTMRETYGNVQEAGYNYNPQDRVPYSSGGRNRQASKRERAFGFSPRMKNVMALTGNQMRDDEPPANKRPRVSILSRLGPKAKSVGKMPGPKPFGRKTGPKESPIATVKNLTVGEMQRLIDKFQDLPIEALHCAMCDQRKFSSVRDYLVHQNTPKHLDREKSIHLKINATYKYLLNEAQLAYARKFWKFNSRVPMCELCEVPVGNGDKLHMNIQECWVLHKYVRPTGCCFVGFFSSRLVYENHCLSIGHLKKVYEMNVKYETSYKADEEKLNELKESFKEGLTTDEDGKPFKLRFCSLALVRQAKAYQQFGKDSVPDEILCLLTTHENRDNKPFPRPKGNNPNKFQFKYFDPEIASAKSQVLFDTEFKCSLCGTVMEASKEKIVEHCSTKEHYDNVAKKQERLKKLRGKLTEQEEVTKKDEADSTGGDDSRNKEEGEKDSVKEDEEDIDIYDDPYEGEAGNITQLLEEVDEALEDDEKESDGEEEHNKMKAVGDDAPKAQVDGDVRMDKEEEDKEELDYEDYEAEELNEHKGNKSKVTAPSAKGKVTAPAAKNKITAPATEDTVTAPAAKSKITAPAAEDKVTATAAKVKITAPAAEDKVTATAKDKVTAPAAKGKITAPAVKGKVTAPAAKGKVTAPTAKDKVTAPAALKDTSGTEAKKTTGAVQKETVGGKVKPLSSPVKGQGTTQANAKAAQPNQSPTVTKKVEPKPVTAKVLKSKPVVEVKQSQQISKTITSEGKESIPTSKPCAEVVESTPDTTLPVPSSATEEEEKMDVSTVDETSTKEDKSSEETLTVENGKDSASTGEEVDNTQDGKPKIILRKKKQLFHF